MGGRSVCNIFTLSFVCFTCVRRWDGGRWGKGEKRKKKNAGNAVIRLVISDGMYGCIAPVIGCS